MARRVRPFDTNYFHYHNANIKNKNTSDCVVRALCGVMPNKSYEQICRELLEVALKTGNFINDKKCYEKYLEMNGFVKMKQPKKSDGTKYTGKQFCLSMQYGKLPKFNTIMAHIGGHHVVAIIDGKVNDTWDSTEGCIGNYYIKESSRV